MASFDEQDLRSLEDISNFADTIKKIHDISNCHLDPCSIGWIADELHAYVYSQRQSLRLEKDFFKLYKKNPQGFDDSFCAVKNKHYLI